MKKFFSFVAAVLFAGSVMADWSVIQFTADAAKGTLNDSVFAVNGFSLKLTDTDNNKLQIDANPASFGSVESRDDYSYRLKTGGKSSSKNNLTLTLPEAGTVRIAVRTGSNADATRTVVAVQGEDTLSNRVAQEADTIVGATSPRIYYYHEFEAEAGVVNITYPVNSVNFYAFAFEAATATPAGTTCAEVYNMAKNDVVDLLNDVVVTYSNGANVWVKDETASMLIYLPSGFTNNFQAGDVLSGVAGVVDIYQTLVYEVKPSADQAAAITITEGEAPAAEEVVAVTAEDINEYVILKGAAIEGAFTSDSKTSLPAVLGENTVTIYNNFKFAYTFEAGKTYDIIGVVSAYKGNPQVYFISAEEAGGEVPPTPSINYYVAGSMGVWGPDEAYRLTPNNQGLYEGEFTFAANDEFKVIGYDGTTVTWFPEGMNNNYVITEAGDYKITFNPAGNVEGWYEGFFNVVKKEAPSAITCADVYSMAKNDVIDLLNDVVVTYSNGANVWVKDETAAMLIYLPSGYTNNFKAGDVLSGVAGVVDIYQTLVYEVKPSADQAAAITITEGEAPAADEVVAVTAEDINEYVILKGAAIEGAFTADAKTSLPAVLGENTVTIYNNFKFAYTFEAGKTYDIIGVVSAYKGNPQVYFISAEEAEAPGEEINVTISSLTNPGQVLYADAIASYGYWDIYAYNDQYKIEISNTYTTEAAGTYTIDDLDAKYTYIVPAEGDTVHFTAGQVVLSITDGVVNVAGQLTGDDNNIYNVNLTYKDPVAEQTVNVNIPKGVLFEGYATYGLYAVYGYAEDSTYVQLAIWTEAGFEGEFTEDDLDNQYVGSGLKDAAGKTQQIYAAAITVTPGAIEGAYTITADLLCYNNTLYKVTMKIGEEQQGINNVEAAVEAIKRIVNGQLVIEKAGKTYNVNGAVVR